MKNADHRSWTPVLPLAPLQQGMLFHGLREPGSAVYFQQLAVRLAGPVDAALLREAWQAVLQRHDALRLRVQWQGQAAPGFATGEGELPFAVIDHAGCDPAEHEALRREFLQDDRARGFALDRPPLMRVTLLRWSPSCWDMVWSHHHALVDGWSSGLVLAEVVQSYEAALEGRPPELAPASSFRTFLQWLAERDPAAGQRHWQQALAGMAQPTPIPLLRRAGGPGTTLALAAHLGVREAQALARLAAGAGVSAATPVFACWGLLLGRHAGSRDVMFGLTASGRPPQLAGSDRMVGLFINTIPLRLDAPRAGHVGEWLAQVQRRLAGALEHQHTALTDIARWSGLPPGQPLFESLVAYENYPLAVAGNRLGPARIERVELEERPSVPLALLAEPGPGGLSLRLLADGARIAADHARSMLDQLLFLLEQLAGTDAAAPVAGLQLLRPAQRSQILHQWNATERPYDREATLPGLFAAQARRTPAAPALIDGAGTLTYAALQRRVEQVAERLALANLPPCSPVGVRLGRGRELVVALLAVGAAGHHYVPIEPALPAARVAAILQALPVRLLLTDGEHLEGTRELAGARAVLQVDAADGADPVDGFACRARPEDPAYVIFTSGSTGRPKGVLVRHTRAVNLIEWVNGRFGLGPADRLLFVTSPAFDLSVYDVFGILAAGGAVRIASEAELADPQRLADLLVNDGITFWDSAPAALWQLAPLLPERPVPAPPAALRLVFLSGDWVPLPLPDRIRQVFPAACIVALGGATEATIWSNFHVVDRVDPGWASVPYGRPIQNARYYVLDDAFEPCPPGVPGDLFIGGECLADGYVGQPELTAERFMPDPFCARPGARMYRTGDRARFGADGVMEFLGRVDTQVKLRGFRIELGEIEVALARHPAVRDAACVLHDRGQGGPAGGDADPQIVGYYVPRAGHAVTDDALRRHLAQLLPAPMLPALLVAIDALPLSANGKVDRKRLPLPQLAPAGSGRAASGDALRDTVAAVWCEVLSLDAIGHDDDFFALGGHSLRATSAVARLRAALGADIPLRLIFEQPTVRGMADALRRIAPGGRPPADAAAIPRLDPAAGLPLSRAQSRLWFLHQLEPDSPQYNVALAARVDGRVTPDLLARALAAVIARHPELDAVIAHREAHPVMLPAGAALPLPFRAIDLTELVPLQREAEALAALTRAARVPFALERERPVRLTVVRTEATQAYVLILMDHIATDGWSIALFAQELLAACEADLRDEQLPPPAAPLAAEFAAWWDRHVQEALLPAELAYWRQGLAGLQPLALATDHPRPARPALAGTRLHFTLDAGLSANLRRTAQRHSATLFMLLLAAFDVLLRRRSGRDDFAVGTDIAGRDHPVAEGLLGFFVNQLVLRTDFSGAAGFADMLDRVRRCALEAFFHQHVPFEALVRELNPVREPGAMPLFQQKFVLQNAPLAALRSRAFEVTPLEIETGTAKYDLLLTVIDEPALRGTLEYSTELFRADTAQALVREFEAVLAQVAADATVSYESLCRLLDADGEERADTARRELRRSGLQRLRELTRPGAAP